jgi:hypothetical protein
LSHRLDLESGESSILLGLDEELNMKAVPSSWFAWGRGRSPTAATTSWRNDGEVIVRLPVTVSAIGIGPA